MENVELIANIFISLYSYEKDICKINFMKDNNGKFFYFLNKDWVDNVKNYLCFNTIKNDIKNKKINENNLRKDKKYKDLIKAKVTSKIKNKFPENLMDEKIINSSFLKYENKSQKISTFYYSECSIIQQKYFKPLHNLFKKNNIKFKCNKTIFWKDTIIIEINYCTFEVFKKDKDLFLTPHFLLLFKKSDFYFDKFLYYESLENFLVKENIEPKNVKNDKNVIIYNLSKDSTKNLGKLIDLSKSFKINEMNINQSLPSFEVNQKKMLEKFAQDNYELKQTIEANKNMMVESINKNNALEKKLKEKDIIINNIKNQYENQINQKNQEIQQLNQKYNQKLNEKDILINNLKNQYENQLNQKNQEIQQLKTTINQNQNNNFNQNQINNPNPNQINQNLVNINQINQYQMIVPIQPQKPKQKYIILPTFTKIPKKGLVNIGSTCYMNATLQCFSQTAALTDYFLNPKHKEIIVKGKFNYNPSGMRLAKEYYDVVTNLWDINGIKYYEPKNFKKVLGTLNTLFEKMEASDAKDMIVFFLEQIHKEINLVKLPAVNDQNIPLNQYNRDSMLNHFVNEFSNTNKSIISDHFFIITETTQKCQNCKNHNVPNYICYNYNIQNVFIFPLEEIRKFRDNRLMNMMMGFMPQMGMGMMQNMNFNMMMPMMMQNMGMNNIVSMDDCFEFNQKEDLMQGENCIYCNLCNQNSESLYGNKILTLPNILIMILNRGKDNMYNVNLNITPEIDLTKFVLNANEQYLYSIYGVITHKGPSGQAGHFIASCKSPIDGKWYQYNDAIVNDIVDFNKEVLNTPTPYILFYERKENNQ